MLLLSSILFGGDGSFERLDVESGYFYVSPDDVQLYASYAWRDDSTGEREYNLEIGDKALRMINNSQEMIVASVFLFDTIYGDSPAERDIVGELTDAVILRKKQYPDMVVVLILDPINRGYCDRVAPAVEKLVDGGVVVFYSDLLGTKSANFFHAGEFAREATQIVDRVTFGLLGKVLSPVTRFKIPVSRVLDEDGVCLESIWMGSALKANHRKLLVTDIDDNYECLISSANPHNASIPSANYAISLKGDIAKYVYNTMRADALRSAKLKDVIWPRGSCKKKVFFRKSFPAFEACEISQGCRSAQRCVGCVFITEQAVKKHILEMLSCVGCDDVVRIQMFYLSEIEVLDAIVAASLRTRLPLRIILDANKDAFGIEKDGTPNRQVAAKLMKLNDKGKANIEIRWYNTHGEQNHAKIISVTNTVSGKYELMTGSANWTGKNLNGANLESNVRVVGAEGMTCRFNGLFDSFWNNKGGVEYTLAYSEHKKNAAMLKWYFGERIGFVAW